MTAPLVGFATDAGYRQGFETAIEFLRISFEEGHFFLLSTFRTFLFLKYPTRSLSSLWIRPLVAPKLSTDA
jgi:hypothetical protein